MASSSLSQESLDRDDYEIQARRSRIRALRCRTTHKNESMESGDYDQEEGTLDLEGHDTFNMPPDHDSPSRGMARMKAARGRQAHQFHKGKAAKDKRKLREKRRSTGVVHMHPSTESTGDSLDEAETKRNTHHNEVIDADNPQTPEEERKLFAQRIRSKSPSDLEADLEDNQDYDSTVSQSETNLTMIGQTLPPPTATKLPGSSAPQTAPTHSMTPRSPGGSHNRRQMAHHQHPHHTHHPHHSHPHHTHTKDLELNKSSSSTTPSVSSSSKSSFVNNLSSARDRSNLSNGDSSTSSKSSREQCSVVHWRDKTPVQQDRETELVTKNTELQELLDKEREENKRLQNLLDDKDRTIRILEEQVALLNKDLDLFEEENHKLHHENKAMLNAFKVMGDR